MKQSKCIALFWLMTQTLENAKLNTYLGNKGYTLYKSELSIKTQLSIKEMLTVKPFTPGSPVQSQTTFPAYRESEKKLYIPRYVGEELFGPAKTVKIPEGDDICLEFKGKLRDYQIPIVQTYLNHVKDGGGGLLELYCGAGKTDTTVSMIGDINKKTIIIVHKEFLMNQWIERILKYYPTARIGKIQGQTIDIDDKDIVIAMLQSLSMKDYPSSTFDSFGFTIIDEVHHISSEVFSCALFKLVTKYMLGLSATMNRKDGTSKVFKMFLGPVVYKLERKAEFNVQVRAITFKTKDVEFNETVLDWKGSPQISTMISKLCSHSARTEFIIKVLTDFIEVDNVDKSVVETYRTEMLTNNPKCAICENSHNYLIKNTCCNVVKYCLPCIQEIENPITNADTDDTDVTVVPVSRKMIKCPNCDKRLKYEQNYIENPYVKPVEQLHTLILSHNLNVLHYIYNKIVCKNIASVGYYVGGMKDAELKKSATKQVVLASFSMASEALDIPTLNAEFLISPKTDIVQCVGRILRAKHALSNPIIYDIKDVHDVFYKQWLKRKAYYKKEKYTIVECDSYSYSKKLLVQLEQQQQQQQQQSCKTGDLTSDDEPDEDNPKDKAVKGVCLLKIKK
jgi:superfamily II DNA or RNA helicase